ncbi:MAG TPA: PQQ-binding-like beta-propeller repeat protein [Solirubrobacteraceae bacterium]|jgi:hypothetical protein
MALRGLIAVGVGALLAAAGAAPASASVTADVDMANTGFFADEELVPPLAQRWSIPATVQTVLAADGRVYVTDGRGAVAFDLATGRQLWATGIDGPKATAYDAGVLYVRTTNVLTALDATTGAVRWRHEHDDNGDGGGPVAADGVVYYDTYGQVLALRASDGTELWQGGGIGGTAGLALEGDRLYVAGPCGAAQALSRADGSTVWVHRAGCSGGGDEYPAVHGGRVYHSDTEYQEGGGWMDQPVLSAADGTVLRHYTGALPVFVDGLEVQSGGTELRGVDPASGEIRWRNTGGVSGTIAVGHDVYGLRGERLTAFASEDGRVLWDQKLGDLSATSSTTPVLAAAPGTLLVARDGTLTAWQSALTPAPRAVALTASSSDVRAGAEVGLTGVLGRELRGEGVGVRVEGADWPRGRFSRLADVRAARDGGFTTSALVYRNSRFRVGAPGEGNEVVTVYASPEVVVGRRRVSVRAPGSRLAGRTIVLYRDRPGSGPLVRLGSGRLVASGRGRTRAALRVPRGRGALLFCIRGQLRLGLGRPSALTRRCGARRIALR